MEGKAILRLRSPKTDNIQHLYRESYELMYCEYSLDKTVDRKGQVNSDIAGGNIQVALPILPNDDIMSWVFDAERKYNGEVTINDAFSESLEKVYFEEGRPVSFRFHYEPGDTTNVMLLLTINAQKLIIGATEYENSYK
ncbi:type VI secretion system tube protein TssD [Dysgonomonas sp. 511]|uniref:type VI secretion system tube protein TssD n=1 Tax=Dysgonomonas sp. 511 TaxID=2302930 RepID=UPI0013D51C56|nr:type VI secretion system tube protein TssD [Dysgonomonas sp. 511]NDV78487.1 hypothetical protein [Dysgonomonas sp. 511]